jgi:hypothetical protein
VPACGIGKIEKKFSGEKNYGNIMGRQRSLNTLHLIGMVWFVICSLFLIIYKLREAELNWWVIISLSGPSVFILFLLFLVYLFAIFRGATRIEKTEKEHPLSVTRSYMFFYYLSPCLGGLAGLASTWGEDVVSDYLLGAALGTLAATFAVWIIVDPAISLIEMGMPESRKYRQERIARQRAEHEKMMQNQQRIIDAHDARQIEQQQHWASVLKHDVGNLAHLLQNTQYSDDQREVKAVDIGAQAWRTGGIDCMRWLHDAAWRIYRSQNPDANDWAQISAWWDGIGNWINQPTWEKGKLKGNASQTTRTGES